MRIFIPFMIFLTTLSHAYGAELLSESEALRIGMSRSEIADQANGAIGEAEADLMEAGKWPNPTLDYTRERINGSPGTTEQTWQISQTFDISGRRSIKKEAAGRLLDAAQATSTARRSVYAAEIRRAFHTVLLNQERIRAVEAWSKRFVSIEGIVTKLEKAGEVSGYDRRRLSRERQSAEARLASEQGELDRAKEKLSALLGQSGQPLPAVAGVLLPAALPPLEQALTRMNSRPDLHVLTLKAEAFDLEHKAAEKGWIPDVTLGIGPKRLEEGSHRDGGNILTMSIPLPLFDRQEAGAKRSSAQAMASRAELALAKSQAEGEMRGLHKQVSQLITTASGYRDRAVTASSDLTRIAESAYRAGEGGVLELLDSYRGALEAESMALELEWKAREASIEFDLLTGSHTE